LSQVEIHVPAGRLTAYHRSRRWLGCGVTLAGAILLGVGVAAAELIVGPLGVFAFVGFMALVVGPAMMWPSHQALRRAGDLRVEIDRDGYRHRHGEGPWAPRRSVQAVIAEASHVDIVPGGVPVDVLVLPMPAEEREQALASLAYAGVDVTRPERSAFKIGGVILAVVVGVGAVLVLWRLLILGLFGLVVLGIQLVAPDDPAVQAGLFFGLAFGVGLPVLLFRRLGRWRGAD